MNDNLVAVKELKEKLAELANHFPNCQDENIYLFGKFLSEYIYDEPELNNEISPIGFITAYNMTLYDLELGRNGLNGESIIHELARQSPLVYQLLALFTVGVAKAIFPENFAQEVQVLLREINSKKKKY